MRKLALLTLVAAALGVFAAGIANARATTKVEAAGTDFTPRRITVDEGEKVTFKRVSGIHTVTFKDGKLDKPLDTSSPTVKRKFEQAGTYKYVCMIHGDEGMKGKVVVR